MEHILVLFCISFIGMTSLRELLLYKSLLYAVLHGTLAYRKLQITTQNKKIKAF
jgi:hypothetical protein